MPTSLPKDLRNQLARITLAARDRAESAARAALENLAVHEKDYRPHMAVEQRLLRNRLRARGRALGDRLDPHQGAQEIDHLAADAAYEHWHRLLFTRFLTENHLLLTDAVYGSVPVTLPDCEELAPELGARDGFELACRFAGQTLPGVFRQDDPVLELNLALNDQVELRRLLEALPAELFRADDALGWTYQFWQTRRKEEVNASGRKIGADELAAVTQLFTEDYMVEFLLHNTLGAWWAGRLGPIGAGTEAEARARAALPTRDGLPGIGWTYLRFVQDETTQVWMPAAGSFEGWPRAAKDIKFLDPCMGSGHFLVFALPLLARLRLEEESLTAAEAVRAVLRDNLHGLELDPRCTQIAAFNVALTAWKLGGYQSLPPLHLACCGLAPQAKKADWLKLAGDNDKLRRGMERLYDLFEKAPVLGSLIDPSHGGDLLEAGFAELQPLLEKALQAERRDDTTYELAVTAQGIAKAAEILAGKFTLVATNVPYLGRGKQDEVIKDYCERVYPKAKADIATCFVERCLEFCASCGSTALVTPQNWLFLGTYKMLRKALLEDATWGCVMRLGPRAFETIGGEVVNVALLFLTNRKPSTECALACIDVAEEKTPAEKATSLRGKLIVTVSQKGQLGNPDARISLAESTLFELLAGYVNSIEGLTTGDLERFITKFWEHPHIDCKWEIFIQNVDKTCLYGGRTDLVLWENGRGALRECPTAHNFPFEVMNGYQILGKAGIRITQMREFPCTMYSGEFFGKNAATVVPHNLDHLAALWCFCSSSDFNYAVRAIDQALKVTNATLEKVPFDLPHWQKIAAEKYPNGLPKPHSDDPTQWLFNGHPKGSEQPLHVAVARLLGYRWPRQTGSSFPDCPALDPDGLEQYADADGIVCLPPIHREQPAAARLRALLATALGSFDERTLIAATGSNKTTLEEWLRDDFFEQHCALFHQRPFIWHLWDGRKDGFHVLVNYHRLDHATLQTLTYSYLGDWIRQQEEDAKADQPGAAERLGAARTLQTELANILEGEPPYDLFIRWKPLHEQPLGWQPDLNDGVRLNLRPFLLARDVGKKGAGLLRAKPNIKWDKDRGREPQRDRADYPWFWAETEPPTDFQGGKHFTGHRWNHVHYTLAFKRAARLSCTTG